MIHINPKRKQESNFQNFISPSPKKKKPWDDEEEMPATQVDFMDDLGATQVQRGGVGEGGMRGGNKGVEFRDEVGATQVYGEVKE